MQTNLTDYIDLNSVIMKPEVLDFIRSSGLEFSR
jgi:hypothetical protein